MTTFLKLRESLLVLREEEHLYQIVFTATRRIKRIQGDQLVEIILDKTREEISLQALIQDLGKEFSTEEIETCLESLEKEGILKSYSEKEPLFVRYHKQIAFLEELTHSYQEALDLQRKLSSTRVGIFGIGGIGTLIVNGLTQIGISHLTIIDPDIIEETNLNRQLFFTSKDIGRYKVDVIQERLPDFSIQTSKQRVSPDEKLEDLISECDFFVNCTDQPSVAETTRILNSYAAPRRIPYSVAGGYNLHLGMVGPLIIPGESACFDCFLDYQREHDPLRNLEVFKDVEDTGNIGPLAGVIGNLHVLEIFKYLIGKGEININRFAEINFMNFEISWRNFEARNNCTTCHLYDYEK